MEPLTMQYLYLKAWTAQGGVIKDLPVAKAKIKGTNSRKCTKLSRAATNPKFDNHVTNQLFSQLTDQLLLVHKMSENCRYL